ncbi:MAG TPA: AAA family ATPase [Niabella sp.]|nr:AAA family ATPase [Niabella sp.]
MEQKIMSINGVFDGAQIDTRILYMHEFGTIPSSHYMGQINGEKAFPEIKKFLAESTKTIYQRHWYKKTKGKYQYDKAIIVLNKHCIVELDEYYCEILHNGGQPELIEQVTRLLKRFQERNKRQPLEINLIVQKGSQLTLKEMEIKKTKLDLDLFYEDDFKQTHEVILRRLKHKKDKGIVLLHGLPGTGKTTYLRFLIGKIRKRVLFLSPSVAGNLTNPDFIELLVNNPETVLVIEDAESIMMNRKYNNSSSVSNLLNISDGLLADFLNVQVICTFNSTLSTIDDALLRKGRLIARYEFGKLGINKSQTLSNHLGFDTLISEPMSIAEIANQNQMSEPVISNRGTIGFRMSEQS